MTVEQVDLDLGAKITEFKQARDAARRWGKRADDLRKELDHEAADAFAVDGALVVDADGIPLVRVKKIEGLKLDQKRVRSDYPEVYAACQVETVQTRLEEPTP